jgi:hypothetical protein
MSLITDLAAAMVRQEGSSSYGTAGQRYNNPGNLMDPKHAIWPQYPTAPSGEVIFPDQATGESALENDLRIKIARGMTLTSLITMYAPPSQNDTAAYIANVSSWTGLPTNVPLNTIGDTTAPAIDPNAVLADLGLDSSLQAGSIDWGMVGIVGLGLLAAWYFFSEG